MVRTPISFAAAITVALAVIAAAGPARADVPRVDFAHPVEGESMVVTVDRLVPDSNVVLVLADAAGRPYANWELRADGAGVARRELPVTPGVAGNAFLLRASDSFQVSDDVAGVFQTASVLVTGTDAAGIAWLYHYKAPTSDAARFTLVGRTALGRGTPGGAVRDGHGTRSYVVADTASGALRVVDDVAPERDARLLVPADVRDIVVSEDGRQVFVVSAGDGAAERPALTMIDTATDRVTKSLELDPLGTDGGRIVLTPDGLRAFVSVRGLFLREINLRRFALGSLVAIGEPGQDAIRDLKLVDGHVFALSGGVRLLDPAALTGIEVANLRDGELAGRLAVRGGLGVGAARGGQPILFLLDGRGGAVTLLDAATLERRRTFDVPGGADALLLPARPDADTGALLYRAGAERASTLLRGFVIRDALELTGADLEVAADAAEVEVAGFANAARWLFLANGDHGLLAIRSEDFFPTALDIPLRATMVSIAR